MTAPVLSSSQQARAARDGVLVVPARDRAAIVVRGKDRSSWLNGLVTCDVAKVVPGRAAYGLLVEKKGKIEADFAIVASEDALLLAVPRDLRDALLAKLDHYLIMEDAALELGEESIWFAHGPRAGELLRAAPFAGTLDLLGTGGVVLAGPAAALDGADVALGDEAGWEALRIEHGLPRFGVEVDTSMYPQEASLETLAVSFEKGCYLGQEVVYMLENRGHVKKKLVPLDVDGAEPLAKGTTLKTPEGEDAGEVKSSVVGPTSGRVCAIAMVKWAHVKAGAELRAGDRVARVRASDRA
ncbi:MAG TPA: glycine cleavage T C-terminal barrel domain-containing protein [Labilithrix sp.]